MMPSATYTAIARRREEQGMTSTCRVVKRTTSRDPDPVTAKHAVHDVAVYEGPCEYVAANTQVRAVESGARSLAESSAVLKLPVGADGADRVLAGHIAIVTLDPDNPSHTLEARVTGDHDQTLAVSRRFPVERTEHA